ncbi:NrfD/PsrC family molybdoenzyme membrane anchor subunit [Acidobacteriota bacterium]
MITKTEEQTVWGWMIAAYLFLAGVGAGAYATGVAINLYKPEWTTAAKCGIGLGFPLLAIGTLFLIADLGVKFRALRAFMNPGTSWIARGTIIISMFMILSFVHFIGWIWPFSFFAAASTGMKVLGIINLVFALLTMVYTGVLLGANRSIAFWCTAMLPLLFLISACSTGLMATILLYAFISPSTGQFSHDTLALLGGIDIMLIVVECLALTFYIQATHQTFASRQSAKVVLKGRLAAHFWLGVVVIGLFIPLLTEAIALLAGLGETAGAAIVIALIIAVPGLIGGLFLRYVVLAGGIRSPLKAAGMEYSIPTVTYKPAK